MALFTPAAVAAATLKTRFATALRGRISQYQQAYNAIYSAKTVSPADVWTALGADAATILQMQQTEQEILNAAQPGCVPSGPPAGWTVTANTDGTVTAVKTS